MSANDICRCENVTQTSGCGWISSVLILGELVSDCELQNLEIGSTEGLSEWAALDILSDI